MTKEEAIKLVYEIAIKVNDRQPSLSWGSNTYSLVQDDNVEYGWKFYFSDREDGLYTGSFLDFFYMNPGIELQVNLNSGESVFPSPADDDMRDWLESTTADRLGAMGWAWPAFAEKRKTPNDLPDALRGIENFYEGVHEGDNVLAVEMSNRSGACIELFVGADRLYVDGISATGKVGDIKRFPVFRKPLQIPLGADTDKIADVIVSRFVNFWNNMLTGIEHTVSALWEFIKPFTVGR